MKQIKTMIKRNLLWLFYVIFLVVAFSSHSDENYFIGEGPYWPGKLVVWLVLLLFLIYSLIISSKESFFKSLKRMSPILWTRQIGLDLYLGLLVPLTLIYLNEGSLIVLAFWFVPIFIFANLATLVYLALNFESLIAAFIY